MAEYDIDRTAAAEAATLVRDLLQTEIPTGDFTQGGAASDLAVDGHAIVVGWLRAQINIVRERQSLRTIRELPATESVSDAADAILDNFFRTRGQGRFAKGVATIHLGQRVDVRIGRTIRFFRTASLVFYLDSDADLFIGADELRPNVDATGTVVDYTTTVFLTAARVGVDYNAAPGRFVSVDRFSPFLTYVEHLGTFADGDGVQSTVDFIDRSRNAISLRALINARSNEALLLEQFASIQRLLTVGYGEPEMMRDRVANVANVATVHVGGHTDLYVRQTVQQVVERLTVATLTPRNDGAILYLRDAAPPTGSFVTAGVRPGQVLVIAAGLPEAPTQFKIAAVGATTLTLTAAVPASVATDELPAATTFAYSIGDNYPAFDNKASVPSTVTANTSRRFAEFNRVVLPGRPTYRVTQVELLDPPAALDAHRDPVTGTVLVTKRSNAPALAPPASGAVLGFFVQVQNPEAAQSAQAVALLELGWPALDLTGQVLEVTYDTLTDFAAVDAYVEDRFNRPSNGNLLVRGYHPVYLTATVPYRLRTTPLNPLVPTIATFDPTAAEATLTAFVNGYSSTEPIDTSLLATTARTTSLALTTIYPFVVTYELVLPDGRVMTFTTQDQVTVFPDGVRSTAALLDPTSFGLPATGYHTKLRALLADQGVSDRNVRYLAAEGAIAFVQRS